MNSHAYNPVAFHANTHFASLLHALYASNEHFDFFLEEYERAYDFCVTSKHIQFYPLAYFRDEKLVAHCALICDDRLPPHEAFFGFFETINDVSLFEDMWHELVTLAHKHHIQVLKGPVNGSIWHQYRCVTESSSVPFFKTEPISPLYYCDFLMRVNPISEITYSSGIRKSYTDILQSLSRHADTITQKLVADGFRITVTTETTRDSLLAIAQLSTLAFDDARWGYTQLDSSEFSGLYDVHKINDHIYKLFLLYHKDILVGYCSTMREGTNLICKTICIAPQFQGMGLGNALALKIHEEAASDGIEKIMYVLVRDGNKVHNYPTQGVEVFRKYAVFDFKITI